MRVALVLPLLVLCVSAGEESLSAFEFRTSPDRVKASIDLKEVFKGVRKRDPRDAIPAIDHPVAVPAEKATWIKPKDRVLGIVVNGEARAYPLRVLEGHEMVNDVVGGVPVGPNY